MAESFELAHQASCVALRVAAGGVAAAQVVVNVAGAERVRDRAERGVLDRSQRAAVPEPGFLAAIQGTQVGAVGPQSDHRGVFERGFEVLTRSITRVRLARVAARRS